MAYGSTRSHSAMCGTESAYGAPLGPYQQLAARPRVGGPAMGLRVIRTQEAGCFPGTDVGYGATFMPTTWGKVPVAGATPLRAPYAAYCTFIAYAVLITALRPHYAVHRTDVALSLSHPDPVPGAPPSGARVGARPRVGQPGTNSPI
eukprot:1747100-Rhodomonas_salina.2